MDFKEAYQHLEDGKKVRRKIWDESLYLEEPDLGNVKCFRQECIPFVYNLSIISSESDWMIVGDNETYFAFIDMIEPLKQGKQVKLVEWPDNCFIEATKNGKEIFMRRICEYDFTPTFECLGADDWEVIE